MSDPLLPARIDPGLDLMTLGQVLADAGYFGANVPQAIAKVLMGRELGIGPVAAMTGIHVIDGKPSVGAHLIAAAIKRHPRYDYRVREKTDERCAITFFERVGEDWQELGTEVYTVEDAQQAQLTSKGNWKRHPKAMLFARCIGIGYRTYCPDVFDSPVYAEGEIEEGGYEVRQEAPPPAPPKQEPEDATFELSHDDLRSEILDRIDRAPSGLAEKAWGLLEKAGDDRERLEKLRVWLIEKEAAAPAEQPAEDKIVQPPQRELEAQPAPADELPAGRSRRAAAGGGA